MGRCERLKWNRRKLGMTQEELAKKVGVSQKTISNLETDETAWASMRDSTADAVYNMLRKLASWQSDIHSIFKDNASEEDIRGLRKKVREKRQALGMSQTELGMMLGLDYTTICNYEKHDKAWKSKRSTVASKLMDFLNGKYDSENVVESEDVGEVTVEEKVTDIIESADGALETTPTESAEDTLNAVIDILQEKLIHKVAAGEDAGVYVGMIAGVCDGYLKCKKED